MGTANLSVTGMAACGLCSLIYLSRVCSLGGALPMMGRRPTGAPSLCLAGAQFLTRAHNQHLYAHVQPGYRVTEPHTSIRLVLGRTFTKCSCSDQRSRRLFPAIGRTVILWSCASLNCYFVDSVSAYLTSNESFHGTSNG